MKVKAHYKHIKRQEANHCGLPSWIFTSSVLVINSSWHRGAIKHLKANAKHHWAPHWAGSVFTTESKSEFTPGLMDESTNPFYPSAMQKIQVQVFNCFSNPANRCGTSVIPHQGILLASLHLKGSTWKLNCTQPNTLSHRLSREAETVSGKCFKMITWWWKNGCNGNSRTTLPKGKDYTVKTAH